VRSWTARALSDRTSKANVAPSTVAMARKSALSSMMSSMNQPRKSGAETRSSVMKRKRTRMSCPPKKERSTWRRPLKAPV
jgi:hypothetical protein